MKKTILIALMTLAGANVFAESIPVRIQCQAGNGFVKSASQSMGSPYYYEKQTLLVVGTETAKKTYIIQNQEFDKSAGVAHMTGEAFQSDIFFNLMINFTTGGGTFTSGGSKVALSNCKATEW